MRKPVKRKPVNEVWREIGIVTIGVLIALAVGEVADFVRWQMRVSNSMAGVREDLSDARYTLVERQVLQPCIEERLKLIGMVLKGARTNHRLPKVEGLGFIPFRKFELATWEVAKSEGVTLHMPRPEAISLGNIYSGLAIYPGASGGPEAIAWSQLLTLENAAGPVDSGLLSSLTLVYELANNNAFLSIAVAREEDEAIRRKGIPVHWGDYYPVEQRNSAGIARALREWGACPTLKIDGKPFRAAASQ